MTEGELEEIGPLLFKGAAGLLLWWKARKSPLVTSTLVTEFHQAARSVALQQVEYENNIRRVFQHLRGTGIEPMLVKGWAVARHYADPILHPPGDIDLIVSPQDARRTAELIETLDITNYVDLKHEDIERITEHGWDDLFARSELVPLGDMEVRVMGYEDHLAFLSMHCFHHGCERAVWLCDIAAALEARPDDFDWERCLGRGRRADLVLTAICLAHALLGAEVRGTPAAGMEPPPEWIIVATLRAWQTPLFKEFITRQTIVAAVAHPSRLPRALADRWPGPIEATLQTGAPWNDLPRFPFQFIRFVVLTARVLWRLPQLMRGVTPYGPVQ